MLTEKKRLINAIWNKALDAILPPRCLATGEIVDHPGALSPAFWPQLSFIEEPFCASCGTPFPFDAPSGTLCVRCLEFPPAFDRARAAVIYDDASRKLVLGFKYGDRLQAVHTFAPWMARAGKDLIAEADLIVPVPLHRRRLWQRRFNQSALLAQELAAGAGKTCLPAALLRLRHTVPQKGLNAKDRRQNVKNAFGVNPRHAGALRGKNILLIDDVFTSGATLGECASALKDAGAAKVFVLTIALVTKGEF